MTRVKPIPLNKQRSNFFAGLRGAGWKRPNKSFAIYRHPDGGHFNADQFVVIDGYGYTLWRWFANAGLLPSSTSDSRGLGKDIKAFSSYLYETLTVAYMELDKGVNDA